MKLIIIRHAQSTDNQSKLLGGNSEARLTEKGRLQAALAGKELAQKYSRFDLVFSSPRKRCVETAEILLTQFSQPVTIQKSELLTERHFGQFSGQDMSKIDFRLIDNLPLGNKFQVEPLSQLESRVNRFIEQILQKSSVENILIVSHSNPLCYFITHFEAKTFKEVVESRRLRNAQYLEYTLSI